MELKIIFVVITFLIKLTTADEVTSSKPSACNNALRKKFEEWKAKFKVTYETIEEEENRREIFCSNSRRVQNHNGRGNATYTRAENKHSDKTSEERNDNMLGAKKPTSSKVGNRVQTSTTPRLKTKKTKRSKTTKTKRTKSTKNTVKNRVTTRASTVRYTTRTRGTIKNQAATLTTRKTTFPWTTRSPPTTRSVSLTRSTTRTTSTSTESPTTTQKSVMLPESIQYTVNTGSAPDSVNYTSDCTPAKDQYGCGSCWAFAAVVVTEYWRNKAKKHANLSEQDILDCNIYGDDCDGGWPTNAFSHMINPGNSDGSMYSYKSLRSTCKKDFFPSIVTIPKVCEIELNGNETLLKELVWRHGPISVVIYVLNVMYSYSGGIYYESNCPSEIFNHAVTVVGYGSFSDGTNPKDYWIIKNSWGSTWGYQGYGLMARNQNNHCAIASYAMYPC